MKKRRRANRLVDTLLVMIAAALLFAGWSAPASADSAGMGSLVFALFWLPTILAAVIIVAVSIVVTVKNRPDDSDNPRRHDEGLPPGW